MFSIDERLRGIPAAKDQVVQLFQSLNQPHLAVPGRKAGPATAYVVGLRGAQGFAVFVYLYLSDTGECAVYVPSSGTVAAERYQQEENEALSFVESMGFIMDNLNFRARPPDEQDQIMRMFPVFQREPPPAAESPATTPVGSSQQQTRQTGKAVAGMSLGKFFSSFCLTLALLTMLLGAACAHTERDRQEAMALYDLALQVLVTNPQDAFRQLDKAISVYPDHAESWHLRGILYHQAFGRPDDALASYMKAIKLKPDFSEARVNLGNLYMDRSQYEDAIHEYELALKDVLYNAPFIAQGNMGWAFYKKGDIRAAFEHLRNAVQINPKYCLGHMQLGVLNDEQGNTAEACKSYAKYRESCPERADAYRREGICLSKSGDRDGAQKSFRVCLEKTKNDDEKEQCTKLAEQLQ